MRYLLHRLGRTLAVLVGVTALLYLAVEVPPGPVDETICGDGACPPAVAAEVGDTFAADEGPAQRAVAFAIAAVRLEFGPSLTGSRPAGDVITGSLGASTTLAVTSVILAIGVLATVVVANLVIQQPWLRIGILAVSVGTMVVPLFWSGMVVRAIVGPGLLPAAAVLAFGGTAFGVRAVHERVRSGLDANHVRLARSYGVPERRIVLRHGVRPAVAPALEALATGLGVVLGGLILLEPVFGRSGVGAEVAGAVARQDRPVVLAGVFVLITTFVILRSLLLLAARAAEPPRSGRWEVP